MLEGSRRPKNTWILWIRIRIWIRNTDLQLAFTYDKISGAPKQFKKWPRPLFRPRTRTNHTCHQKPHPSRETIPLNDAGKQRGTAGGVTSKEEENLQASGS
jgi:hypothetical protein